MPTATEPTRPRTRRSPSSGPTRVAVVGAGFIADFHLQVLIRTADVDVVCVCDADQAVAERLARRYGVAATASDLAQLPTHEVDLAHLLVPPTLHARLARELLELGIGVFVEKPLALSSAEARELGALAAERGLALGVNHNAVHFPAFAELLRRLRAGDIGSVQHVQVTLSVPLRQLDAGDTSHWMFREPQNIVFEQGPHPFAQLYALVGRVRHCDASILASRELLPGQVFHERWLASARAERGTAEVYFAFGQSFTRSTVQVLGSDGSLQADVFHNHLEGERKTQWLDFWNSFLAGWRRGGMLRRSALRVLFQYFGQTLGWTRRQDGFFTGMRDSIQSFHRSLRAGSPPPAGAEEAVGVLEWCEAMTARVERAPRAPAELAPPGPAREGEIVLLGATGFIGRRTVAALLERDVPVTCVVRRTHSLPSVIADGARSGRVRLVPGSLEDPAALEEAFAGASCVVHLATGGGATWDDVERAMVRGTEAVGRAAARAGARLVYVSSTAALYLGRDAGNELDDAPQADPRPDERAPYARGKVYAERALFELCAKEGLAVTVARPGVVLGPGTPMQHSGLGLWVRDNHCVGWGPGRHPLPLVLADDVADALARAATYEGPELHGRAFNLASGVSLSAADVVAELRRLTGRDLHFHPRPLAFSQTMEIGKWLVKKAGRQQNALFPSWRDLKSRELYPRLSCRTARERLGWRPVDDDGEFLRRALAGYA